MEETPGTQSETLAQLLAEGPLESGTALDILRRVLKALAFRHWTGEVHGHVTPKAIVLTADGQVTLTGFKPSSRVDALPPVPIAGTGLDPRYMAPEQIAGVPADARADVFAVGVIGYEMLVGQHPFGADKELTGREVMSCVVNGPSRPIPPALLAHLPAYVGPALDIALAKDRDDRFPDAESLLEALRDPEAQAEASAEARVTPAARRLKRAWLRYYALPAALAVVTLVVVLLALTCAGGSPDPTESTVTSGAGTSTGPQGALVTGTTATVSPTTTTTAPPTTTTVLTSSTTLPPAPPITTRYEETAAGLTYTGIWSTGDDVSYSGGRFEYANASGATVTASFNGTYLAWIAKKSPAYGTAKVTLDGTTTFTVDLYDANTLFEQKAWDTGILPAGLHTVTIEWTGIKNASATDTNICVDAFDVEGALTSITRVEQTDPRLVWGGAWTLSAAASASGGDFRYADSSGASVTIDFTGQSLDIIAKKGPSYGQATVTLDGDATFTVDLYDATATYGETVWSSGLLAAGDHTVKIEWAGTKNAAATGTNISLDAVDVDGSLR